jgi:hypothetical protein
VAVLIWRLVGSEPKWLASWNSYEPLILVGGTCLWLAWDSRRQRRFYGEAGGSPVGVAVESMQEVPDDSAGAQLPPGSAAASADPEGPGAENGASLAGSGAASVDERPDDTGHDVTVGDDH